MSGIEKAGRGDADEEGEEELERADPGEGAVREVREEGGVVGFED